MSKVYVVYDPEAGFPECLLGVYDSVDKAEAACVEFDHSGPLESAYQELEMNVSSRESSSSPSIKDVYGRSGKD